MKLPLFFFFLLMISSILFAQNVPESQKKRGSEFLEKRRNKMIEIRRENFDAVDRHSPPKQKQERRKNTPASEETKAQ